MHVFPALRQAATPNACPHPHSRSRVCTFLLGFPSTGDHAAAGAETLICVRRCSSSGGIRYL